MLQRGLWTVISLALLGACPAATEEGGGDGTDTDTDTDGTAAASATAATMTASADASASAGSQTSGPSGMTGDPTSATASGSEDSGSEGSSDDATTSADCTPSALEPGEHVGLTLEHDGVERNFDLFIPEGHDDTQPATLVLNFHGLTSNAGQQAFFSEMNDFAGAGVVVAYPNGLNNSWNAGVCCGLSMTGDVDDVGFVRALIEQVSTLLCIDPSRVFATGMSNGGFMSHRLACEASDLIAAIAPVAGVLGVPSETCDGRPVPVIHFHGTLDTLVPYGGGFSQSVADTMAFWVDHNGCAADSEVTFEQGDTTCETWTDCTDDADVTLCTVENGGHCWPGNAFCPVGTSTEEIHASEAALEFFADHPLP